MTKLQAIIPAFFQPIDIPLHAQPDATSRAAKLSAFAAITLAVLVVGLIAALMGMT
jgi:hypothetical protein